jgi:nucleotide-binding universal stress UspA family protein
MRILYATDGSPQARSAGALLSGLNLSADDRIAALTVDDPRGDTDTDAIFKTASEDLSGTSAIIENKVRQGYADEEILGECQDVSADLLVVGAKGASDARRFLLGSITARVMRYAPCSVLVVRPGKTTIRNVLLAFDGTGPSCAASAALLNFPLPSEVTVHLMAALPPMYPGHPQREPVFLHTGVDELSVIEKMSRTRDDFIAAGRSAVSHTVRGEPASSLLDFAETEDIDFIVLGSHGTSLAERFHRFLLGSVAEKVARYASSSVLLVRTPGE